MLFYDEIPCAYEVHVLSADSERAEDTLEIRMVFTPEGQKQDFVAERRVGNALTEYLNDGILMSIRGPGGDLPFSKEQERNFRSCCPTEEQTEFLRTMMDDVLTVPDLHGLMAEQNLAPRARIRRFRAIQANFLKDEPENSLTAEIKMVSESGADEDDLRTGIKYTFHSSYEVLLFDAMEAIRRGKIILQCRQCKRYFFPKRLDAVYCSAKCREQSFNHRKDEIWKAIRRAYKAKSSYIDRQAGDMLLEDEDIAELKEKRTKWHEAAREAGEQYRQGLLNREQFCGILEMKLDDIDLEETENRRRKPGSGTRSGGCYGK